MITCLCREDVDRDYAYDLEDAGDGDYGEDSEESQSDRSEYSSSSSSESEYDNAFHDDIGFQDNSRYDDNY